MSKFPLNFSEIADKSTDPLNEPFASEAQNAAVVFRTRTADQTPRKGCNNV